MPRAKTRDIVKVGFYFDRQLEREFKKLVEAKFKGQPSKAAEAAVRAYIEQNKQ